MDKTFPVIEIFGPTIQGEGALAGLPTLFVRFGGCDFRCSWCDSMYAVDPAEVRENAEKLTVGQIIDRLNSLVGLDWRGWVTLSGGNPALMPFGRNWADDLIGQLHSEGFKVSVETQGSVWREWLRRVDHLTVSPKPPSSGMWNEKHRRQLVSFLGKAERIDEKKRSMKIVIFTQNDLDWARTLMQTYSDWPQRFLSVGTDQDHLQDEWALLGGIAERYRWLCETVAGDPSFASVRVLPQMHVLAWGAKRGV